jgi:hypothetical protein
MMRQKYGLNSRYRATGIGGTRRRGMRTTGVSTTNYDKKNTYKYKRMPRRKRKKYMRKFKLFRHFLDKSIGSTKSIISEVSNTVTAATPTNENTGANWLGATMNNAWPLYVNSTATNPIQAFTDQTFPCDVTNSWQQVHNIADGNIDDTQATYKTMQNNNNMECILTNSSTENHMICDVYTIVCRKDLPTAVVNLDANPGASLGSKSWIDFLNELNDPNTSVGLTNLASSPFVWPEFCKYFKVLRVQQIQIPAGDCVTLSMRDNKNRYYDLRKIQGMIAKKGWTKGFLFKVKGIPNTNAYSDTVSAKLVTTIVTNSSRVDSGQDIVARNK